MLRHDPLPNIQGLEGEQNLNYSNLLNVHRGGRGHGAETKTRTCTKPVKLPLGISKIPTTDTPPGFRNNIFFLEANSVFSKHPRIHQGAELFNQQYYKIVLIAEVNYVFQERIQK